MNSPYVIGAVVLLSAFAASDLSACGDKFLIPNRGMRFELTPAARQQVAVLLYANPTSALKERFDRLASDTLLQKAGYRLSVVDSVDGLDTTLRGRNWDVVMLDAVDAGAGTLTTAPGMPAVVAVVGSAAKTGTVPSKGPCISIVKSSKGSQAIVQVLDSAVVSRRSRAKSATFAC